MPPRMIDQPFGDEGRKAGWLRYATMRGPRLQRWLYSPSGAGSGSRGGKPKWAVTAHHRSGASNMNRDKTDARASVYLLDEYLSERTPVDGSIVIEQDGTWHRARPDVLRAAMARHPSVRTPGRGTRSTDGRSGDRAPRA